MRLPFVVWLNVAGLLLAVAAIAAAPWAFAMAVDRWITWLARR